MKKRGSSKVDEKYLGDLSEDVSGVLQRSGMAVDAEAVQNLLTQEGDLRREVDYLHKHGMPDRVLSKTVGRAIANLQKTGGVASIRPEDVALSVYEVVRDNRRYGEMADELLREGIIDERDVKSFERMLERGIREHGKDAKKAAKSLEREVEESVSWKKAAIYILFAVSAAFLIAGLYGASITGAVIGGGEADFNVIFGIMFLLLGLAVHHFSAHK